MKITVVYESLFGNTQAIAEAIAEGLQDGGDVSLHSTLEEIDPQAADLLVIGGPTHIHGMSRPTSRHLDDQEAAPLPGADEGPGIRELIKSLPTGDRKPVATFDTRLDKPAWITGSAASAAGKKLERRGYQLIAEPESFIVEDMDGPLQAGELDHARMWGKSLLDRISKA
jgi:hypothetical protein